MNKVWTTEDMERICREHPRRFEAVLSEDGTRLKAVLDHDDGLVFTEQEDGAWMPSEI